MNKASGGDGIPVELIQILKDDAVKVCTQYDSKFGKFSRGHRTGKGSFHCNPYLFPFRPGEAEGLCSNPSMSWAPVPPAGAQSVGE